MSNDDPANSLIRLLKQLLIALSKGQINKGLLLAVPALAAILWRQWDYLLLHPYDGAGIILTLLFCSALLSIRMFARTVAAPKSSSLAPVIKGGLPFLPDDAEVFSKLGRTNEVRTLLTGILDGYSNKLLLFYGPARVGKTSVLRAGVQPELKKRSVACAYWRFAKTDNVASFRQTVLQETGVDLGTTLVDFQPHGARAVIIIDQFELVSNDDAAAKALRDFLVASCNQPHPYRLQVIVAIREESLNVWEDIQEWGIRADMRVQISPLSMRSAKGSVEAILAKTNIQVHRLMLRDYLKTVALQSRVSPVYIATLTRVYAVRSEISGRQYLGWFDYTSRDKTFGVFAEYLQQWLRNANVKESDQLLLIRGLLAHGFDEKATVAAERASGDTIAAKDVKPMADVNVHFTALASPDWGVLEKVDGPDGSVDYRFSAPRFNEVLRNLSESATGEGASLFSKHLQRTKNARQKLNQLKRAGMIVAIPLAWCCVLFLVSLIEHFHLGTWKLPPQLYERQRQLEALDIGNPSMTDLTWAKSKKLQAFGVDFSRLASLNGIENFPNLDTLNLDLTGTAVDNLRVLSQLDNLQTLSLFLGHSKIQDLTDLIPLRKLTTLTLQIRASSIQDLSDLTRLPNLTTLTLELDESQTPMIGSLHQAQKLRNLVLLVTGSSNTHDPAAIGFAARVQASELGLSKLTVLHQLQFLQLGFKASDITNLPNLGKLSNLTRLCLDVSESQITEFPALDSLLSLQSLTLVASNGHIKQLPKLSQLKTLDTFISNLDASEVVELPLLPSGIKTLRLDTRASELLLRSQNGASLPELHDLEIHLDRLKPWEVLTLTKLEQVGTLVLHLDSSQIEELPDLASLDNLNTLILYINGHSSSWARLSQFHNIAHLTLNVENSQTKTLPDLSAFGQLTDLRLNLEGSQIATLPQFRHFPELNALTLNLAGSQVQSLDNLRDLVPSGKFQHLEVNLENSQVAVLPDLTGIKGLQTKLNLQTSQIKNLAEARRMGVKEITIDHEIQSLSDLPKGVTSLSIKW